MIEEHFRGRRHTRNRGEMERSGAVRRSHGQIGTGTQEDLDHAAVSSTARDMKRSMGAVPGPRFEIRSRVDENFRDLGPSVRRRQVQRGETVTLSGVDVGPLPNEGPDGLYVPPTHRVDELRVERRGRRGRRRGEDHCRTQPKQLG